jgi:AcrR family transcriptional regulator
MDGPARQRPRRVAQTARGQQTRAAILGAARQLCSEKWLDQLSLAELARTARTTRASVLFQFPEGWLDIAAELMVEEFEAWREAALEIARSGLGPEERLRQALQWVLERGAEQGAFLPNVRAFNLVWGELIDTAASASRNAAFEYVADQLRQSVPETVSRSELRTAAELLAFFAIDLVCTPMYRRLPPQERAAKLDAAISLALAGLSKSDSRNAPTQPCASPSTGCSPGPTS